MLVAVGGILLASAAVSFAIPMQFTDCVDSTNGTAGGVQAVAGSTCSASPSANDLFLSPTGTTTLTFSHNVSDNGFLPTDSIASVSLLVDLRDDGGPADGNEQVDIFIDFNGNNAFDAGEQVANDVNASGDFTCTGAC